MVGQTIRASGWSETGEAANAGEAGAPEARELHTQ
jgi:hypothetical protein